MNKKDFFEKIGDECDIDITGYVSNIEEVRTFEDLIKQLEEKDAFKEESEFSYFDLALKYLLKNDPSLSRSLYLANERNYTVEELDSLKLAALVLEEEIRNCLEEHREKIENYLNHEDNKKTLKKI